MTSVQPVPPREPPRGHAPGTGWKQAPLRAAVSAHQAAAHPGQAVACKDPVCQKTVSAALAAEFDRLPAVQAGRLFPA